MSAIEHIPEFEQNVDHGLLRFLTCGSVDDGKSTLIGRLLYDTKAILADTLHAIEKTSAKRGLTAADLSLLTDGLLAEREQGITIDVAYRYFTTGTRKYIIADAPGHEQYTRNMVTAASTADLAIILVDARRGVLPQTKRHSKLAHMMGTEHLVVAVNKMDLVGYDEATFRLIEADYLHFATRAGITDIRFVPMSARRCWRSWRARRSRTPSTQKPSVSRCSSSAGRSSRRTRSCTTTAATWAASSRARLRSATRSPSCRRAGRRASSPSTSAASCSTAPSPGSR